MKKHILDKTFTCFLRKKLRIAGRRIDYQLEILQNGIFKKLLEAPLVSELKFDNID